MSDTDTQGGSASFPRDDRESTENPDPLNDENAFEDRLKKELFNTTVAAGIDNEEHHVGRVYEAHATAKIRTHTYEDGSKRIHESDDLTPNWIDQEHYRCHTCGMKIQSRIIAFLHASEKAPELVEHLPPAVRANVSKLARLEDFYAEDSD
jgi:hypothetical protein